MFSFIKGRLREINEDYIVVENDYYGFEIFVPHTVFRTLTNIGEEVKIYTYFQPREDSFNLYGFLTKEDKEIFKKLLSVNGIGAKAGLAILSVLTVSELKAAISTGDFAMISRAQGIGKKTAQKVILELKDKIDLDDFSDLSVINTVTAVSEEALDALIALGYSSYEARTAIRKSSATSTEDIIKDALKDLSKI